MKIYVAGKTHHFQRVRTVQHWCRVAGHHITYDWTTHVEHHGPEHELVEPSPDLQRQFAELDLGGVKLADLVIALGHPKLCGTLIECGAALAWNKKLWLVGVEQPSVFWHMDNVTALAVDVDVRRELEAIEASHAGRL